MTAYQFAITAAILVLGPFAIRSTWRLFRLWRADNRRSLLLLAFWVVALLVTVAGAWIGFLIFLRALGHELWWAPPITGLVTVAVLAIPLILDSLVQRVASRPNLPDNIGRGPE